LRQANTKSLPAIGAEESRALIQEITDNEIRRSAKSGNFFWWAYRLWAES